MTAEVLIRPAVPADADEMLRLVHDLADFERAADRVRATAADYLRDGFGERPVFQSIVADAGGGRLGGFTLFFPNYSTWDGRPGLYVEDLYVEQARRGQGLGRRLLVAVAAEAVARGYTRVDLSVLDWNPARGFYERLGFVEKTEWIGYRAEGEALGALAREAEPR